MNGNILLVGRSSADVEELIEDFKDEYAFAQVESAKEGLEILHGNPGSVSVIWIDRPSTLPGVKELVDFVTGGNQYIFSIPILVLTEDQSADADLGFLGGAVVDCIERPFHRNIIRNRMQRAGELTHSVTFEEFARMLRVLPSNIYLKDANARYVFCSQTWHHLEHYDDPDWTIVGKTDVEIRKDKENALLAMRFDQEIIRTGKGMNYVIEENEGTEFLQLIKEPLFTDDGHVRGIIALINNVTEQEEMKRKLHKIAVTDKLTGLYNRRYGMQYLAEVHEKAASSGGSYTVFCIDMNHFKTINDTYGHEMGDIVLKEMGERLGRLPEGFTSIRTGGDEFMIVLTGKREDEELNGAALLLQELFSKPVHIDTHNFRLSASIGAAVYPKDAEDTEQLIRYADAAMYAVKHSEKRADHRFFDTALAEEVARELRLGSYLKQAVPEQDFELYYQPQIDTQIGEVVGMEAFLRFRNEAFQGGELMSLLSGQESAVLLEKIGRWTAETALKKTAEWSAQLGKTIYVSINLLPIQLTDEAFLESLQMAALRYAIRPSQIVLDLSGDLMGGISDHVRETLVRLHEIGFRLSVNDYDGHNLSLLHMVELCFDYVKLSRNLLADICDNKERQGIVRALTAMAEPLGITVVAVGVENEDQSEFLKKSGIGLMQGYLFGRPKRAEEINIQGGSAMYKEYKTEAEKLVTQMSVKEAAEQLLFDAPAIERLGIPAYNYWSEGLHGIARGGTATVFPQAIALAAMFDTKLLERIADVVATETRAKYNEASAHGDRGIYKGITLWSPNVNIFRDPRWGRGQETYGEDPYLTSELGAAFIKGLQGSGKYLKTAACAKHFAVHSGPESLRHSFDAVVSPKDLEETYLPAFRAAVTQGEVESVMGAYNRTNGEPCCANTFLLEEKLRKEWEFDGHVVSDFGAIRDFHENHHVTADAEESAARALKAGCNLNAGQVYESLYRAYEDGMVTEEEIRMAAVRVFTTRFRLGMFADDCEYDDLGLEDVDTSESRALSYEASLRSIVMIKNDGLLPIDRSRIKTLGVIGPLATSLDVLNGNYNGTASQYITNLDGIRAAAGDNVRILYSEGCHLFKEACQPLAEADDRISEALSVAEHSDVVVLCLGLDSTLEGEEGDAGNAFAAGDKESLYLPDSQRRLFGALKETGKPIVLVINTGSAMDISREEPYCAAVLQCWYSGQYGGKALGDILFGAHSPSAKLPVTFSFEGTLPEFTDYSMDNRTYRYIKDEVLYPFGYGLSYTSFVYEDMKIQKNPDGKYEVRFKLSNTGNYEAHEIAQVYISNAEAVKGEEKLTGMQPKYSLCAFTSISLKPGERCEVNLKLSDSAFDTVCADGKRIRLPGRYILYAGGHQPDKRSETLCDSSCLQTEIIL